MPELDFVDYHRYTLPSLLAAGRDELLDRQRLPVLGLSISGEPESFSYCLGNSRLEILPGTEYADVRVELSATDWRGLVGDLESIPGILYGGRLVAHSGDLMDFVRWEPALRALYTGRPIYDPATFELRDQQGHALEPMTGFTTESSSMEMRDFLDAAGYLVVRGVFSNEETGAFRAAASEIAAAASEGDQLSWWGKNKRGCSVLCRCLNAGAHPAFAQLYNDPRIERLVDLLPPGMRHPEPDDKDGITVVFKNPGSVTAPARAGDITLHIRDVMHAAPPPDSETGPFRQSVLLAFHPDFTHHRGERHYNDVLLGAEDGQVPHLRTLVEE